MTEVRLFEEGTIPLWTTPGWYDNRDTAPHLEQDGHRQRLLLCADMVTSVVGPTEQVVDLGCGDGGLLSLLPGYNAYGWDLQMTNVDAAEARGVDVRYGNVLELDIPRADTIVATEMLEHLIDPHGLLARIHASGSHYLVASSPYTETNGGAYEFHTWAWDLAGYAAMIEAAGFQVLRQETAWIAQCVLAVRL